LFWENMSGDLLIGTSCENLPSFRWSFVGVPSVDDVHHPVLEDLMPQSIESIITILGSVSVGGSGEIRDDAPTRVS